MDNSSKPSPAPQSGLWIQSYCALGDHPKVHKLCRILAISHAQAIGHLHYLWWWAMSYAQDGSLTRFDSLDIAIAARWQEDEKEFVDALTAVGFIDDLGIHDWPDYGGKLLERRRQDADRKRKPKDVQPPSNGIPPDVQRTSDVRVDKSRVDKEQTTPLPPTGKAPNGAPAGDYRSLLGDDYWSALKEFKKIDAALGNGWLGKALNKAPPGLSGDAVWRSLENALNRIGDDFQRDEAEHFIKSRYGWASRILEEEFTDMKGGS